jgi:hypothetical protein
MFVLGFESWLSYASQFLRARLSQARQQLPDEIASEKREMISVIDRDSGPISSPIELLADRDGESGATGNEK